MHISLVDKEDLSPQLREWAESGRPGVGDFFIQALANAPEHAERFIPFYYKLWFGTKLEPRVVELVRLAVARSTECPVCRAARMPDAAADGLTEVDIDHVTDPDYPGFSARESAAVRYAYMFADDHLSIGEAEFAALHEHFTEEELAELAMLCAVWLGFSRMVAVFDMVEACPLDLQEAIAAAAATS